jgi:hypothetical protein
MRWTSLGTARTADSLPPWSCTIRPHRSGQQCLSTTRSLLPPQRRILISRPSETSQFMIKRLWQPSGTSEKFRSGSLPIHELLQREAEVANQAVAISRALVGNEHLTQHQSTVLTSLTQFKLHHASGPWPGVATADSVLTPVSSGTFLFPLSRVPRSQRSRSMQWAGAW